MDFLDVFGQLDDPRIGLEKLHPSWKFYCSRYALQSVVTNVY